MAHRRGPTSGAPMYRDSSALRALPRARRIRAVLGAALAVALGTAGISANAAGSAAETEPSSRVIVVMDGQPALAAVGSDESKAQGAVPQPTPGQVAEQRADLHAAHRHLLAAAEDAGLDASPRHEFTGLIDAVALTVPESDVDRLSELPGVVDVVPDRRIRTTTDVSVPLVGAPQVWEREDPDGTPARGEGTTVAVIDTGIDYTNPSLGGAFGPEHKVVAGYDFVNGDADPMDDDGHGTHVAGIIAGDGDVTGMAPKAELTAYKVINDDGVGWESDIIAGLEAAVDPANPHRADVVNLSLGGPGDGTEPLGRAATATTEMGVVVVASAGNSGPGEHTVGTPAVADGVLSVGASMSGIRIPAARMVSPREEPIQAFRAPYSASPPEEPVTGQLVDVGEGTPEDYERVGDVTGKVVAYRQAIPGTIADVSPNLLDQARLAEDRGAIALLAYSGLSNGPVLAQQDVADVGEPGTVDVPLPGAESGDSFRMDRIVVLGLADLQWEQLQRDLAAGPVEIAISGEDVTDRIASFSSRGPTSDFAIEPDLVAPGVEISSTWPTGQWKPGVYRLSGTSMAAPHVAGAAALLRQLRPDASVGEIGARLVGSATPVHGVPTTAGSGRLDVAAAASAQLYAAPTSLSMGLADLSGSSVSADGEIVLHNAADHEVSVDLRVEQAPGSVGTATVTPAAVTVPAGGELAVEVAVSAERPDHDADLSGWVVAEPAGDGVPQLRVPYLFAVRPMVIQTSPDPSDGASEAFVWSPAPLAQPPVLTVTPPHGRPYEAATEHDHGSWYRAELEGGHVGAYTVDASASTQDGIHLVGSGSFEVAARIGESHSPAQWQPIGPNGAAGEIATTPADPDAMAVAQKDKAGPWTTDDGGRTWRQHNRLPVAAGTGQLVVDADDPDTMWYAVNGSTGGLVNGLLDPTYRGRVLRTHDGGQTWQTLDLPDIRIDALLSDSRTSVLVALTADSLLVSRDGGDEWTAYPNTVGSELTGVEVGGNDLFLANYDGVWAVRGLIAGEPTSTEQVYDAGEGRVDGLVADDVLVAVLTDGDTVVGSLDGGASWDELYDVPDGGAMDIAMDDGTIMVSTYREHEHLGRNHGTSWSVVPQPVFGSIENDFTVWDGDDLLWSSPGAGLFRTGPGGESPQRIGVQGTTPYDLAVTEDANGTARLLAGTDADVFSTDLPTRPRLEPGVAEWGLSGYEAYIGTRVGQLAVAERDPQTVWKVRKDARTEFWVYRSTDGGQTWEQRGRTSEIPLDLVIGPTDPNRVVVPFWSLKGVGLYVTTDAGQTWRKLFHDQMFTTVVADRADPDRLWLGSASGLYRSDDFGQTVQKVADGQVTAVAVSGSRIVAGGGVLQVSDDGGQTFTTADSGDLQMLVSDVLVSPVDPDTWYAGTGSFTANGLVKGGRGVLRSTDGGQSWVNVSSGLQNLSVSSLVMSPDGRWLYAGTVDGGVHRVRSR